jgi:putative endonuclease
METNENTRSKGVKGEEVAADYLAAKGFKIVKKNYFSGRYEIDIIAENDTQVVFVEVKTRSSNNYGEPWEAVNKQKQRKICYGADNYIRQSQNMKEPRFDIISVVHSGGKTEVLHLENAFYPTMY